jgi:hypothetical protein
MRPLIRPGSADSTWQPGKLCQIAFVKNAAQNYRQDGQNVGPDQNHENQSKTVKKSPKTT